MYVLSKCVIGPEGKMIFLNPEIVLNVENPHRIFVNIVNLLGTFLNHYLKIYKAL